MATDEIPTLDHLEWLIEQRGTTNQTALRLLSLFEAYPEQLGQKRFSVQAQELVAIAFSLWRAVFLADRKGRAKMKISHAEAFLRKLLVDNTIGFAQDRTWREWSFTYYMGDARLRLEDLRRYWPDIGSEGLQPPKGERTSKKSWKAVQDAFARAVEHLATDLEEAGTAT